MRVLFLILIVILGITFINAGTGRRKGSYKRRPIVGGVSTDIGRFPYQISVAYLSEEDSSKDNGNDVDKNETINTSHFCGGSIISVAWVLCAAHCLDRQKPEDIAIRVGSSIPDEGGYVHYVDMIIIHANYDKEVAMDCDIALIKVKKPFEIGPNVQPIPLNRHSIRPGSIVVVTGWGTTSAGGDMSQVLQKVEVPVLPFWECEWLYNTYKLTQYMFCAGRAGRDSCQGDSGGPVMFDGHQVGVVSWGEGCGFAGYPGIYTNVYKFRDWIRKYSGV